MIQYSMMLPHYSYIYKPGKPKTIHGLHAHFIQLDIMRSAQVYTTLSMVKRCLLFTFIPIFFYFFLRVQSYYANLSFKIHPNLNPNDFVFYIIFKYEQDVEILSPLTYWMTLNDISNRLMKILIGLVCFHSLSLLTIAL